MNLVIVESPAKGKTIEKYLGPDYKVLASFGHVRDLPQKKLGVDTKKNFEPMYEIPAKAEKVLKELRAQLKLAKKLYLATDYDREGEAIAWHLVEALKPKIETKRITFHEITKPAIEEAIKNPREIDLNLVDAQQARRILDRLVGYKLSPFLWRKVAQGLSAGRVQSVALRLIVEKEREIKAFIPVEYWNFEAKLENKEKTSFLAQLTKENGKSLDKLAIKTAKEAEKIKNELQGADFLVADIISSEKNRLPSAPFTTSTLQQEAARKLGYSVKQTMMVAQKLYEAGHITYMRTDSVNISPIALAQAQKVITEKYGAEFALEKPRIYQTKSKGAQEAHEAIRPTDLSVIPEKAHFEDKESRLYKLIWARMLASQMAPARFSEEKATILAKTYTFEAKGLKTVFDGFLKAYRDEETADKTLPKLVKDEKLNLLELLTEQRFTEPPARFGEGSLIKELEKRGIGRPSTYAPTISTIVDRGYVQKTEGKLLPEEIGLSVNDILVEHFPEIVDYNFTAEMEEKLDQIAEGKFPWEPVIKDFYVPFSKHLAEKMESVPKTKMDEETDEKCPNCSKPLSIKMGRFGKFYACTGFPECKFTRPLVKDIKGGPKLPEATDEKCPKCGKPMVMKEARFGPFLACSGYPDCKQTKNIEIASTVPCPKCSSKLLYRRTRKGRGFWGCSAYPKCKTAFWDEPTTEKCKLCGNMMVKNKSGQLKCSECKK